LLEADAKARPKAESLEGGHILACCRQ
jgi:hypothetical protein